MVLTMSATMKPSSFILLVKGIVGVLYCFSSLEFDGRKPTFGLPDQVAVASRRHDLPEGAILEQLLSSAVAMSCACVCLCVCASVFVRAWVCVHSCDCVV